jgi:hypothetical protein
VKFNVKVVMRFEDKAALYEFDDRKTAFAFAESLFGDHVKIEDEVKYVAIAPVRIVAE